MRERLRGKMKHRWGKKSKKTFGTMKLNNQINRLFITIIIIYTLVMGVCMFYFGQKQMYEYAVRSGESVLISIGSNIKSSIETTSTMSKMIMFSDDVIRYLQDEETRYSASSMALKQIYSVTNQFPKADSVYIFRKDCNYINISDTNIEVHLDVLQDINWRKEIEARAGGYLVQINGNGLFSRRTGEPIITFLRMIYNPETQKELGIIAINYLPQLLEGSIEKLNNSNNRIAVVSTDGRYLCGQKDVIELEEKQLTCTYTVQGLPIRLLQYEKIEWMSFYEGLPWLIIVLGAIVAISCFLIIRFYISVWITRPIEKLVSAMKQVEQGWLRRVSVETHTSEIRNLKDCYNQMLIQVNKLINELVEQEKVVQQAKMEVMLEQLNPHFLYNTLETIGYMALESPREKVYEAVENLGEFYRYFLNMGSDTVPLKTEINSLETYLKIQKYRYGEILSEEYEIEPKCEACLVPKLILQPLVENSLYHGIRPKGEEGKIIIRAKQQDAFLVLTVYDTGIGMTQEKIEHLKHADGMGFGLKKTLERIKTIYGQEKTFEIKSEEGSFCEISLFIPYKKD